ncbi:unnamed protein product [Diamesa tonsa]
MKLLILFALLAVCHARHNANLEHVNHPELDGKTAIKTKIVPAAPSKPINYEEIFEQYYNNAVYSFKNSTKYAYKLGLDTFKREYKDLVQYLNSYKSSLDTMAERSTFITEAAALQKMRLFLKAITNQIEVATSDFELVYDNGRMKEMTEGIFKNYSDAIRDQVFNMMKPIVLIVDTDNAALNCIKNSFETTFKTMTERADAFILERIERIIFLFKFNISILKTDVKETNEKVTNDLTACMKSPELLLESKCINDFVYGNIEVLENQLITWSDLFVLASEQITKSPGPDADIVFENIVKSNIELNHSIQLCTNVV